MKILGIYVQIGILVFGFSSCVNTGSTEVNVQNQEVTASTLKFPQWLLGDWRRINDAEGEQTFEYWEADVSGGLIGKGFTISAGDTVFMEHLSLENIEGVMNYVVRNVNPEPTAFSCVWLDDSSFVCNNELNPFPKNISYSLQGDTLVAIIDDGVGGNEVTFLFVK